MCRRNGRVGGREKIVAAIRANVACSFGGWGWRQSMGIWEAGPTAFVYFPASLETSSDRLPYTEINWFLAQVLGPIRVSVDHRHC
jgi:hypothetical protein